MTESESEALMHAQLRATGFSTEVTDVRKAWKAFTAFVRANSRALSGLVVAVESEPDASDLVWLTFEAHLTDESSFGWRVGCAFARTNDSRVQGLTFTESHFVESEDLPVDGWLRKVESSHVFQHCLDLAGWSFRGVRF